MPSISCIFKVGLCTLYIPLTRWKLLKCPSSLHYKLCCCCCSAHTPLRICSHTRTCFSLPFAEYLALLAGFGLQKLRSAASQSSGRRPIDLVNALRFAYRANDEGLGPTEIDWKQIGRDAVSARLWRTAVGVDNMLGPLHAETRVRRVAQVGMNRGSRFGNGDVEICVMRQAP